MRASRCAAWLAPAALLASCAGFSGRGLVAGESRVEQVEALMGRSADRRALPDGGSVRYYSRLPYGRETYAARFAPDGTLRAIEQRLTVDNAGKLKPGMPADAVRELLGPPASVERYARLERDVWTYPMWGFPNQKVLYVQVSFEGVVREVYLLDDRRFPYLQ